MREATSLLNADRVNSVLYFTAPWCGPCRVLGPLIEGMHSQYYELNFIKVNIDEAPEIATEFKVQAVPTVLLIVNGEEKKGLTGLHPKTTYDKVFQEYVGELD